MKTNGSGVYSIVTDNSSNWNTAYTYSQVGHLPLAGGTLTGNLIVGGNLTVNGTTTTLNTQTVEVEDNILQLNTTQGSPDTATATTSGISIYRGDGVTQASFIFDDADDTWDLTNNLVVTSSASDIAFFKSSQTTTTNVYITNTNATANNTANLYFAPANNIAGSYIKSTAIEDFSTSANRTSDLRFGVRKDGTFNEAVIIDSSGNVGIGTTSPDARFSVVTATANSTASRIGGLEYSGNQRGLTIKTFQSAGGDDCGVEFNAAEGLSGYGSFIFKADTVERMHIDSSGNVGINETSPASSRFTNSNSRILDISGNAVNRGGVITLRTSDNSKEAFLANDAGLLQIGMYTNNDVTFYTNNTERMRITSGGNINLGSGSLTQVAYQLRVDADVDNGIYLSAGSSSSNHALYVENTSGSAEHLAVRGDGQIRLNASSVGRVLVGTTVDSTYDRLQVTGNAWIGANATQGIRISNNGANGSIVGINQALSAYTALELRASGTNGQLFLATNGNVGIGETSPDAKLHIVTSDQSIAKLESSNSDGPYTEYYQGSTPLGFIGNAQGLANAGTTNMCVRGQSQLVFAISSSEKMRIDSSGNVGIGVSSGIDANLRVDANSATLTQEILKVKGGGSGGAYGFLVEANNGDDLFKVNTLSYDSYFPNGNVGIGVTSPSEKLEVTGNFKLNGTVVQEGTGNNLTYRYRTGNSSSHSGGNATVKFGRLYWTPAHWSDTAPVIKVTIHSKYYQGERREYIIKANYGDANPIINELQPSSTQQKIGLLVGTTTSAGYNYAGQPVYYADLMWCQTAYIWGWCQVESQVPFLTSNPTSGWGGVVVDSSVTQTNNAGAFTNYTSFFPGRILFTGLDGKTQVHPDVSYRTSDGELFYQTSSIRYKKDIVNLESSLNKVDSLRPVRFTDINTNEPSFGLIAEETNEVIPDVVFTKDDQIEGISYSNLTPFLIKAIQELKAEIETLKLQING